MSVTIEIFPKDYGKQDSYEHPVYENIIGHVIAMVIKGEDGSVTLERLVAVNADTAEDNELAESVVKTIERKLNEAFPDPNQQVPEPKLWVPE